MIDPPYEEVRQLERAAEAIAQAWRKWATGIYALWYPVNEEEPVATLSRNFKRWGMGRALRLELQSDRPTPQGPLSRCGLFIVNPPFQLDDQAITLLPWLASYLGSGQPAYSVDWLCDC